jgi:hypothetical protein
MEPIGADAVAWRGAVYVGVETSEPSSPAGDELEEGA